MTLSVIKATFGAGGRNMNPGSGRPTIAEALRGSANGSNRIASEARFREETIAASSNAALLAWEAEILEHVVSLAGTFTGPLTKIGTGDTLATGEYQLAADRRTLAFFAADAITSINIAWLERVNQTARQTSANAETYVLVDGQTLTGKVDGGAEQTATFETADFGDIGAATAAEVAAVITTDFTGATAEAIAGDVAINSDTKGGGSSIEVTGGTANTALGFPTTKVYGAGIEVVSG